MKALIHQKVKVARESIDKSQSAASRESGYSQSGISLLESGENKFIPSGYLSYLVDNGINLSAIFNDTITVDEFTRMCQMPLMLLPHIEDEKCINCEEKDKEIGLLKNLISHMEVTISTLQRLLDQTYPRNCASNE